MDDIEDKKAGVSEMMDILTETPEDDVEDLERELAESMERDKKNGITYKDESPSISESITMRFRIIGIRIFTMKKSSASL